MVRILTHPACAAGRHAWQRLDAHGTPSSPRFRCAHCQAPAMLVTEHPCDPIRTTNRRQIAMQNNGRPLRKGPPSSVVGGLPILQLPG